MNHTYTVGPTLATPRAAEMRLRPPQASVTAAALTLMAVLLTPSIAQAGQPPRQPRTREATPQAPAELLGTGLTWQRASYGGAIHITATRDGTRLAEAQRQVQTLSDQLDAVRTLRPHIIWTRLSWERGRLEAIGVARSGSYANMVSLIARKLFPGRMTAGSSVRALRVPRHDGHGWAFHLKLHPPPGQTHP